MNRRNFLAGAGAALLGGTLDRRPVWASGAATAQSSSALGFQQLLAEPVQQQILPEGNPMTGLWGYNQSSPGPQMRVKQGAELRARLVNGLKEGTAVHWHGLRSDNAMDGVPGLTQDLVEPGQNFDYTMVAPDAGTFWYHSHNRSWEQVARGLYGPLIVEEATPPDVDRDLVIMVDDWRLMETGDLAPGFAVMHDLAHQGRLGNFAKALISDSAALAQGDRLRLRLINVASDRVFPLILAGLTGKIVALDGMPLREPQALGALLLTPAQRVDVIADVTADPERKEAVMVGAAMRDGVYELVSLVVNGRNLQRQAGPIPALPLNDMPQLADGEAVERLSLHMQGGAMAPRVDGLDDIWGFNGRSGLKDEPFARFERGQWARLSLVNDTAFAHGIHLHGHHFYELDEVGTPGAFRDTTLVDAQQARDILCRFDNPGSWLLHCHMLGHQASGMTTWVEVV